MNLLNTSTCRVSRTPGAAGGGRGRRQPAHLEAGRPCLRRGYDEAARRYCGLRGGQRLIAREDDKGLLVRPEVARRQMEAVAAAVAARNVQPAGPGGGPVEPQPRTGRNGGSGSEPTPKPPVKTSHRRYHGSVAFDPQRVGRNAGKIAEEVFTYLVGLVGARVRITLESEVDIPGGAPITWCAP